MMEMCVKDAAKYNEEIVGKGHLEKELKVADMVEVYELILEVFAEYKTDVLDALDKLKADKQKDVKGAASSTNQDDNGKDRNELRLPVIKLPTFSGGYETWRSFHDIFISLIHSNTTLSEVEKLHFLKSSINGEAERLLQHLAIDKGNYERAWEILKDRYDHKRVLVNTQLKLFFDQPSSSNESASSIKRILDTSQEIIHSLSNLDLPIQHWDAILVFVILQKLSNSTQQLNRLH